MARKLTTEEFITKAKKVHGDTYDYSKVVYTKTHDNVTIVCKTHGKFTQTPSNHLQNYGCPPCGYHAGMPKLTTKQFVDECVNMHGDRYDYSRVVYNGALSNVTIVCAEHGEFSSMAQHHKKGSNCPKCVKKCLPTTQFIEDAQAKHGDKYDYSKVTYTNLHQKVIIFCPIHGEFSQSANHHKQGRGCARCANEIKAFNIFKNQPTYLYYVKINDLYKIGITKNSIKTRFAGQLDKLTVIETWYFEDGMEAFKEEQEILDKYKEFKYVGEAVLKGGNTELFTKNVLNIKEKSDI